MWRHQLVVVAWTTTVTAVLIGNASAGDPNESSALRSGAIQQSAAFMRSAANGTDQLPLPAPPATVEKATTSPATEVLRKGTAPALKPVPARPTAQIMAAPGATLPPAGVVTLGPQGTVAVPMRPTNSALYPTPRPNIPHQVGGTYYTNQAFAPHEYLWDHTYRAMYGPYYYKVNGGWILTPRGVWNHERWKLVGTEVTVKYRSHKPLWLAPLKLPHHAGFQSEPW